MSVICAGSMRRLLAIILADMPVRFMPSAVSPKASRMACRRWLYSTKVSLSTMPSFL
ncbi:hypothetical protein FQZ97_855750 [compost metagenome]